MIFMEVSLCDTLSRACGCCKLDGGCCMGARPPLTQSRIDILMANGVSPEDIEFQGYKRLRLKPDGFCVLFQDGKCAVHSIKPETCVAGPFTFDLKGTILQIFLKKPSICPMVEFLKENEEAYQRLFDVSVSRIVDLVSDLPPEELAEVLKIEEPETELVAEIRLMK
jgi:Fe-S-cluster containining protein